MKTLKKVLAVVMAMSMACMLLIGCGSKEEATSEGGVADAGSIKIGCTGPLTGDASSYGNSVKNGAELAVKEINAAGGINGMMIDFDMKDDKATAEDASTGYDQLMDWGMQISLGSVTSGSCEAFATSAEGDNLFFMTPSASAANIITIGTNSYRVCFGDPDQGILAAQKITAEFSKVGVIYDTSDTYSTGIYDAFKEEMGKLNAEYIEQSFDADNKKDFSTQVEALKDCDVIFLPIYYTEAGLIAKACAAKGVDAVIYGCDGLDGIKDQIDETVTSKIMYITPFDAESEQENVAAFVSSYEAAYGSTPDQFAADAYDCIYAIAKAMTDAGITDPDIDCSTLCDKVIEVITAEGFAIDGVTGKLSWDVSGACTKDPQVVELNK